ncbi:MAG: hypothetical protein M3R57_02655 [Chloroflexota bacterium]|nr:hypothetical protein [Chloroflexota bacterium]
MTAAVAAPATGPRARRWPALGEDWVQWRRSSNRPGLTGRWAMVLPFTISVAADRRSNLR